MKHYRDQRRSSRRSLARHWPWLFGAAVVVLAGAAALAWWRPQAADTVPVVAQKVVPPANIQSRLQFVGDVFWGRSVQTKAQASGQGSKYLTAGLSATDRAAYDAWVANFECPITTRDVPYQQQLQQLKFNCRPEYLPELAQWFTAVTLANNHMNNNGGLQGLEETRKQLEQNGIQYAGHYDMKQLSDICEVIALPAHFVGSSRQLKLPVALCGYMYVVDVAPTDAQLAVMRQYAAVMPVIAMPHMGVEYRAKAESQKAVAYRRMIDNGADMVIGAHPHVIQNSENYKGRLIAYSLGNFLFDQQSLGHDTSIGLGVGVELTLAGGTAAAKAYQAVGASCGAFHDTCLQQLQAVIKRRPAIGVKYTYTCYDETGGVPKLGDTATCDAARVRASANQLETLNKYW